MIKAGQIVAEMIDILNADNDAEMKARIWRRLNYEYIELCTEFSWAALRCDPITLDFSTATASGLVLPSDLLGIDLVWDDTNAIEFIEKDRPATRVDEFGYRFYRYYPSRSDLFAGSDLILQKGGSSFTSATLTAAGTAVDGEYVQFDDEPGIYEITSDATPFTFEPTYYGENKTQKPFSVRPWQLTQAMVLIDADEDELLDRDVLVYYWRVPPPIYREQDYVLLPSAEVLMLRTLRGIPQSKGKFNVSESMLDKALKRALKSNPVFPRVTAPEDKHYRQFTMGTNPFQKRR